MLKQLLRKDFPANAVCIFLLKYVSEFPQVYFICEQFPENNLKLFEYYFWVEEENGTFPLILSTDA